MKKETKSRQYGQPRKKAAGGSRERRSPVDKPGLQPDESDEWATLMA